MTSAGAQAVFLQGGMRRTGADELVRLCTHCELYLCQQRLTAAFVAHDHSFAEALKMITLDAGGCLVLARGPTHAPSALGQEATGISLDSDESVLAICAMSKEMSKDTAEPQAAGDGARRSESPLPDWMAEAPVPASARKGSPLSLSSSSSGDAERLRSRLDQTADAAGPSGAQQLGPLEARSDFASARSGGDAPPLLAGARTQPPAPLGAGHKQGGGPALAPPFVVAAREGRGRLAGQGSGARAGQAGPVKAESPVREAAAGAVPLQATPAHAKGRGAAGARGKALAARAPTGPRAARTPKASASQEAERPLPAADGDLQATPALDRAHTDGGAQAAAATGPSRAGGGAAAKAGRAQAPAGEVALVMPERLPTKARPCPDLLHTPSGFPCALCFR